jgi:hypothetical protein
MSIYGTGNYAQVDYSSPGQEAFRRKRQLDETLSIIEGMQATQASNLRTWLIHRGSSSPTAQQAKDRFAEARREENRLLKELFGTDGWLAISGEGVTEQSARQQREEMKQAKARDEAADIASKKKAAK